MLIWVIITVTLPPKPNLRGRTGSSRQVAGTLVGAVGDLGDDRDRIPIRAYVIPAERSFSLSLRAFSVRNAM